MTENKQDRPRDPGWFDDLNVFVYGTLKPGGFYWPRFCEGKVLGWYPARVRGRVFHLPVGYPAAHFEEDHWIEGVVLELRNREVLRGIDYLEGFDPYRSRSEKNDYTRCRVKAYRSDSDEMAWVWSYEMSLAKIHGQGGKWVEDGSWIG